MISLCAPTYDPNGHLILPHVRASNAYQASRRGSVTATLDGDVSVFDGGYSVGDETLSVTWSRPTPAQIQQLKYLIAYYVELVCSVESGCYRARANFTLNLSTLTLSLRLLRRLDA